jgi:ATP/maltotriose-dependent transcriptional regulator MalT
MGEGRAWIDELLPRVDELDDRARAELVLTSAVTAIEVGDDARAVAAAEWLDRLGPVADPDLRSLIELVRSWILPIVDDLDGALAAASAALDDFRRQDERFMIVSAAMTLGMLEMVTGRHQEARAHLVEAGTLSARFGNNWLSAGARVQLASLAIEAGDLDQARALLTESLTVDDDARLSTHTVTFCLVTYAELALAEDRPATAAEALGAADALRRHAGLRVWPSARRGEEALRARVEGALPPDEYEVASTRGAGHTRRRAAALIRAGLPVTAA